MEILTISLLFIVLAALCYFLKPFNKDLPVYNGIPFIGFLVHFRNGNYEKKLTALKKTHGDICKVQLGSYTCVWLNDYKLIRNAWNNPIFCGRPKLPGIIERTHGFFGGIIFNDGNDFKEQRRFVVKKLKDLGIGKISMENFIQEEVDEIIKNLVEKAGNPISTRHLFNIASLNILWGITSGERYQHNDHELNRIMETLARNMELQGGAMLAFFMPWMTKLFPNLVGWTKYLKDSNEVFEFWKRYAKKRIQIYNGDVEEESFVHAYIKNILECQDPESSFYKKKGELSLATTLQDLFIAGTETTATTLSWFFLYMAAFPEQQKKLYDEINSVIGQRKPTLEDRKELPLAEAFMLETMRFGTLAPLGMIHCTRERTTLNGYDIPEGTLVHANLCAAHHDPELWCNPETFRPERFLSPDHKKIMKHDAFLAFSYGKRGCPGEALAKNELFIFLTRIVQSFKVTLDTLKLDLSPKMGVSATPQPHKLIFQLRGEVINT